MQLSFAIVRLARLKNIRLVYKCKRKRADWVIHTDPWYDHYSILEHLVFQSLNKDP